MDSAKIAEITIGAFIAALFALMIALWIENERKPRLRLRIAKARYKKIDDLPDLKARFVFAEVYNASPRFLRWISRQGASQCRGTIVWRAPSDGSNIFDNAEMKDRVMRARWPDSSQPESLTFEIDGKKVMLRDPTRIQLESRMDIYSGEHRLLDVAVRFEGDAACYGWSNASFLCSPKYKNTKWTMNQQSILVDVRIQSVGERVDGVFRLVNPLGQEDFRLEQATRVERKIVREAQRKEMERRRTDSAPD